MKVSLTIALLALVCTQAIAAGLSAKVVRVAAGDTVTVLDGSNTQHKIRLQGIYASGLSYFTTMAARGGRVRVSEQGRFIQTLSSLISGAGPLPILLPP